MRRRYGFRIRFSDTFISIKRQLSVLFQAEIFITLMKTVEQICVYSINSSNGKQTNKRANKSNYKTFGHNWKFNCNEICSKQLLPCVGLWNGILWWVQGQPGGHKAAYLPASAPQREMKPNLFKHTYKCIKKEIIRISHSIEIDSFLIKLAQFK